MKITRIVGQQELHLESKKAVKTGFRIEGNRLVKYTRDGRKRNNWLTYYRNKSRKFLKEDCEDSKCVLPITKKNFLTIHHKIALSTAKSGEDLDKLCEEENCQTLCNTCHQELEFRIAQKRNKIKKEIVVVSGKSKKIKNDILNGKESIKVWIQKFPLC